MTRPVFRFAPSPNGRLHLGHARSALLNEALARRVGGRLLLRIEDIDPVRSRPDLVAAILDDLAWLGLSWEEPVRRQSGHMAEYGRAAERLRERGLLYPCFCTRGEVARAALSAGAGPEIGRDPDGAPLYPGTCRRLTAEAAGARLRAGDRAVWRLDSHRAVEAAGHDLTMLRFDGDGGEERLAADPARWGDAVLVRRDIPTSYHLSVVADDAVQGVTHVVRGRDLEAATDLQALLQRLLGFDHPRYHHHDLVLDETGAKLAKSRGSTTLADLRAAGRSAADIRRSLGFA